MKRDKVFRPEAERAPAFPVLSDQPEVRSAIIAQQRSVDSPPIGSYRPSGPTNGVRLERGRRGHSIWEMMRASNVVPLDSYQSAPHREREAVRGLDSAVEAMVSQIKDLIEERNLSVGDSLPSERELCERFTSSRTTVREAMRILKAYGVVEVRPKVGAIIIDRRMDAVFNLYAFNTLELSRETFLDTQGFRRLVEVGAADILIERITPSDILELRAINDAMAREDTLAKSAAHDFRLHARLVSILENRQLDDIYRIMKPVMLKIMENGLTRTKFAGIVHDEHVAIIDALEGRDRFAYQHFVNRHLEAGLSLFKGEATPT